MCKEFLSWNEVERWALPSEVPILFSVYTGTSPVAFQASKHALLYKLTKLSQCSRECHLVSAEAKGERKAQSDQRLSLRGPEGVPNVPFDRASANMPSSSDTQLTLQDHLSS